MRVFSLFAMVAVCTAVSFGQTGGKSDGDLELESVKDVLRRHKLKFDGETLLGFLREQVPTKKMLAELKRWTAQLGEDSYKVRAIASDRLRQAGRMAVPFLRKALSHSDIEVVRRAELCLDSILAREESMLPVYTAVVRAVGRLKPAGAAKTLLDFAPHIEDASVIDEIRRVLPAVAIRNGNADPSILAAAADADPIRRALAADVLGRAEGQRDVALKLLKDRDAEVRFYAARALMMSKEPAAVPTMIALLEDLPADKAWMAEDLLLQLAGSDVPEGITLGTVEAKEARKRWTKWWRGHEAKARSLLARLSEAPTMLGYTLLSYMIPGRGVNGGVEEIDRQGRSRWKITGLRYPVDAQVINNTTVLVVEYLNRRVAKYTTNGKQLWSHSVPLPMNCQVLPNGNFFVTCRQQLIEFDRSGRQVFSYRPTTNVSAAYKTRSGEIVMVTVNSRCIRLDAQKRQIRSFAAGPVYTMGGKIEVLPNGRILVPEYSRGRIVEYSPEGKVLWEARVTYPTSVQRLPNGNTLVVSMTQQKVLEVNRAGRVVWEHRANGRIFSARRR